MIPLPQIVAELVMALGGALLVANALALARGRAAGDANAGTGAKGTGARRVSARGRAVVNIFIGLLVLVWGLASFVAGRAG